MATRQPNDETGARHVADVAPDDLAEIGRWCSAAPRARDRARACGRALRAFAPDIQSHRSLFDGGARALAPRCSSYLQHVHPAGYPSGQRGQTVNLMAMPSQVRILFPPPPSTPVTPSRPAVTPTRASRSAQSRGSARAVGALRTRGRSSVVERQPSKLNVWVRFPSPAPARSAPLAPKAGLSRRCCSSEVEHFLGKEEVMGSIPISSSTSPSPVKTRMIHLRARARRNDPSTPVAPSATGGTARVPRARRRSNLSTAGSARRAAPSNT